MIKILLALCILQLTNAILKINLEEVFICTIQPVWEFSVDYVEDDWFVVRNIDDDVHHTGTVYVQGTTSKVSRVFPISGGDGPLDNYYELKAVVTHSCTDTGEDSKLSIIYAIVGVMEKSVNLKLEQVLNSKCVSGLICWQY